jgi:isoquinoline 1-oxidoreductase alpha subunit
MASTIQVNGKTHQVKASDDTPLLWVLRDELNLTGTKYGCGIAQCGCCTVHIDGNPERSCQLQVGDIDGANIVTIEGLGGDHPIQQAWVKIDVPQCGYCQSGQIMSAVALVKSKPKPTDADIDKAMEGNLCRCGTYNRVKEAIKEATGQLKTATILDVPANLA